MTYSQLDKSSHIQNIGIIGSGISGISSAWLLSKRHKVTVYEKNNYIGGHSNTVRVLSGNLEKNVDTGFIVYNEKTYPNLTALFSYLNVETKPSEMSFAVSLRNSNVEYCSNGLNGFFAQRLNILRPSHWAIILDLIRFYKHAQNFKEGLSDNISIGDFLNEYSYSETFIRFHLLPMIAAIWSVPFNQAADFPLQSIVNFFSNHGLLQFRNRPLWRTVVGGSKNYINKMKIGISQPILLDCHIVKVVRDDKKVLLIDQNGRKFSHDSVIIAAHADEALKIINNPSFNESKILGSFKYSKNKAVLHSDVNLMPTRESVWSSWNVIDAGFKGEGVGVTYWLNKLHDYKDYPNIFLSLNPPREINSQMIEQSFSYDHPLLTSNAHRFRKELKCLQGHGNLWFCGSYFGYGFHEDALSSGLKVAENFGVSRPWKKGNNE